ncbi:NAD(P)/FAD-dependent oxidoreductase [Roseofilum casamattae]|uniref:FAD-binding oxidoreductase n=1 Tax=Roseofilum casamattae BLCC-M143 TaxID=3022442 RepID=A0ABT7BRY9_9CYAN|nr:FAD-binding oxidoreductase [Roseofilum casamattae]MDJ1181945.1 FAD-binding oxidoreductase [Roseofilum casamattae BLCC-M143]
MNAYDWIVIGAGITGSAIAYELSKLGCRVLLLDPMVNSDRATRYSYGMICWYGASGAIGQLLLEGKARHEVLSEELGMDTQFQRRQMLFTLDCHNDLNLEATIARYQHLDEGFELLEPEEARKVEPLLNPRAIAGALSIEQGHVNPVALNQAYQQGIERHGGKIVPGRVEQLQGNGKGCAIATSEETYYAEQAIVCAGGWTRQLLSNAGIKIPVYFTHAELIEIPDCPFRLSTIVTSVNSDRTHLEEQASRAENETLWNQPGRELAPSIIDADAVQFRGGRLLFGQISRALSDPNARVNAQQSQQAMRERIEGMLPSLGQCRGNWHSCLVAFSHKRLAVLGPVPGMERVHLFSGFTTPMILAPAIAPRFARQLTGTPDSLLAELGLFLVQC